MVGILSLIYEIRIESSRLTKRIGISLSFKTFKVENLVDPASSHTLVSKIKPCMCKYKPVPW